MLSTKTLLDGIAYNSARIVQHHILNLWLLFKQPTSPKETSFLKATTYLKERSPPQANIHPPRNHLLPKETTFHKELSLPQGNNLS
jgi:hypothetical protein